MVMVMIALTVGTIITLSFMSSQTTSTAIAYNATRQVQARAVAEDGVRLIIEHLRANPEWRDDHTHSLWTASTDLNGGSFRVMFEDEDDSDLGDDVSDPFIVTVEGSFNGVVHRISNRIVPTATSSTLTVLLVTGNAFHADEDLERIAVIESWGYSVLTVTDSDAQSVYDAAVTQADVIYVSEESASGSVGTKLNGYDIGVVNEEQALQDELKMSTSGGTYTGHSIDITDNTHPITAGFATGVLQITENSTGFIQAGGTAAAGLTTLAERESSSTKVLTVLDVGYTMTDGSPSPQRRVTMPFGSNAFEYGQLNDDGQKLMKQAIDWAAASPTVTSVSPVSRWTLDETVGSLATDVVGGHNGSYETGTTLGASGQVDSATEFDGSSGYVEIGHDDAFLVDEGAIVLWFYLDNTSGRKELFSKDSSDYDTGGHVTMYANGSDVQVRFQDTSSSYTLDSGSVLSATTWHHAALTFGPGGLKLYVDGALVDSDSHTGGMGTSSGGTGNFEPIALGANTWSSGNLTVSPLNNYLDGRLDDVRFYDEQLTAEQVAAVFTDGEASTSEEGGTTPQLMTLYEFNEPDPVTPQLVSHWKLNEASSSNTFVEVDGEVVIEAENYSSLTPGTGSGASSSWNTTTTDSPSGGTALIAEPNSGANMSLTTNGPRLDYPITFTTPGTYRVWVRMICPSGNDHSIHVGLDGVCLTNNRGVGMGGSASSWSWFDDVSSGDSNISVTIPAAGTYTFNVWMREDGTLIDKIVLSTDTSKPSGSGPVESEAGGSAADDIEISDGAFEGSPSAGQSGHGDGGTSVGFNGTDQFIEVPHDPAYLLNKGTLSFWFRANDLSGTQGLIAKDATNYGTGGHLRVITANSKLQVRLQSTSASKYVESSSSALSANTWHHVALGFGAGGLQLYLDGTLVDSDSYSGGLGTSSGGDGNEEPWTFGVDQWTSSSGSTSGWGYPFNGRIDDVRIYDQNLDATQVSNVHSGLEPGASAPALVKDTSGSSPALDLAIADPANVTWIADGGLTIDSATTISSGADTSRLHTAITESDAITVEAVFTPANITQDGPARIVSYSNGTSNRNFHLGQTDAAYGVRLRTEFNTSGTPEAESNDVLVNDTREHVLFTYDSANEELRVYRNGTLEITEEWTGDLDNWNDGYELLLANEASGNRGWLGTLHRVAIYDGAINGIQADNLFNGDPPGDGTGGDEGLAYQVEWLESP